MLHAILKLVEADGRQLLAATYVSENTHQGIRRPLCLHACS